MYTDARAATRVRLLHGIFELQARVTPTAIALDIPSGRGDAPRRQLTYAETDAAAEALAGRLAAHVHGECVVAIMLPRPGAELFIAQLAIMKAGAAWTCFEPGTPTERLRFLIEDSHAVAVVADDDCGRTLVSIGFPADRVVGVASSDTARAGRPRSHETPRWLRPETLAYVIYTSGTTGHPKGVRRDAPTPVRQISASGATCGSNVAMTFGTPVHSMMMSGCRVSSASMVSQ